MKTLVPVGLLVAVLGIASFFVNLPKTETAGLKIGDANIGVQTTHSEPVPRTLSIVLVLAGLGIAVAGNRK